MARHEEDAMELFSLLDEIAHRIVDEGTASEAHRLGVLAGAVHHRSPGVGAALVDWAGSEVARARAFGLAAGVALRKLDGRQQARLLAGLAGVGAVHVAA